MRNFIATVRTMYMALTLAAALIQLKRNMSV